MRILSLLLALAVAVETRADDAIDLLYMGEQRPLILRLTIRVDGKSLQQSWSAYVDSLFERLDANDDQVLSMTEVAGAPKQSELVRAGLAEPSEDDVPEADSNGDNRITRVELRNYFKRLGASGFSFRIIKRRRGVDRIDPVTGEPLSSGFFELVDRNRDQRLAPEELKNAYAALHKYDLDDDESIGLRELGMAFSIERIRRLPLPSRQEPEPRFVMLRPGSGQAAGRSVLAHYDSNADGKLSRRETGFSSKAFDRLDADSDGELSSTELRSLLRSPIPAARVTFELRQNKPGRVEVSQRKERQRKKPQRHRAQRMANDAAIRFTESQIDVIARSQPAVKDDLATYKRIFARADGDKNGYLDLDESRRFRNFRSIFSGMDRNQDGKVFAREMMAYGMNETALANAHIVLIVTEQGRDLAEILDADRDTRLSRREMVGAIDRLKVWDKNGDGKIAKGEVPSQYLLSVGRSRPQLFIDARLPDRGVRSAATTSQKIPVWFRNMDRNGDGDLSRREFLGTATVFKRFDKNNDGLISPDEAAARK